MHGFIRDILEDKGTGVATITAGATVRQAVRDMRDRGIGSLLVVDGERPVGILTERDVLQRVVDEGRSPETTRVREAMTTNALTIRPDARLEEAMTLMTDRRCRHLIVLEEGRVAGLVSIGDVLRRVSLGQAHEIEHLVAYIQGR